MGRRMYVNSEELLRIGEAEEGLAWYRGSLDVEEFYREAYSTFFADNPIATENRRRYFWARSFDSDKQFKKVHDPVGADIIDTMAGVLGKYAVADGPEKDWAEKAGEACGLQELALGVQIPLTLATGTGCLKSSLAPDEAWPSVDFYPASRIRFHWVWHRLTGIDFYDYLSDDKGQQYCLEEKRYLTDSGVTGARDLHVEYSLYRWDGWRPEDGAKGNPEVSLGTLPETKGLKNAVYRNAGRLFAVPTVLLPAKDGSGYGRSVFEGKTDLLDAVDQAWSMECECIRVSSPTTYVPESMLRRKQVTVRTDGGNETVLRTVAPSSYGRNYVVTADDAVADGDGKLPSRGLFVDQPKIDTDPYDRTRRRAITEILNGFMSPATLGVTLDPTVNAPNEAREREKITVMTRASIANREAKAIGQVLTDLMDLADWKRTGELVASEKPRAEVRYSEFANPSLENELRVLGPAWSAGQISTEVYVETLWRDRMTKDERDEEKERLEKARKLSLLAPALYEGEGVGLEDIGGNDKGSAVGADEIKAQADGKGARGAVRDGGDGVRGSDEGPRKPSAENQRRSIEGAIRRESR